MVNWSMDELYQATADGQFSNHFDRIISRNVFNRCQNARSFMAMLYAVAAPGAKLAIEVPYISSDNAWGLDCLRPVQLETFRDFEPQWRFDRRMFFCDGNFFDDNIEMTQLGLAVAQLRNIVKSFAVELTAQKPVPEDYKAGDPSTTFKLI